MPNIPVSSPLSYVGVFLLIFGFLLILAGLRIIKIEKITIIPGTKTWGFGIVLAVIGIGFLLPDIMDSAFSSLGPTPTVEVSVVTPTSTSDSSTLPITTHLCGGLANKVVGSGSASDQSAMEDILRSEAEAAVNGDIGMIMSLFRIDAEIIDLQGSGEKWEGCEGIEARYTLTTIIFINVEHEIIALEIKESSANVTTRTVATYINQGIYEGDMETVQITQRWILLKEDGAWGIKRLEINFPISE